MAVNTDTITGSFSYPLVTLLHLTFALKFPRFVLQQNAAPYLPVLARPESAVQDGCTRIRIERRTSKEMSHHLDGESTFRICRVPITVDHAGRASTTTFLFKTHYVPHARNKLNMLDTSKMMFNTSHPGYGGKDHRYRAEFALPSVS